MSCGCQEWLGGGGGYRLKITSGRGGNDEKEGETVNEAVGADPHRLRCVCWFRCVCCLLASVRAVRAVRVGKGKPNCAVYPGQGDVATVIYADVAKRR